MVKIPLNIPGSGSRSGSAPKSPGSLPVRQLLNYPADRQTHKGKNITSLAAVITDCRCRVPPCWPPADYECCSTMRYAVSSCQFFAFFETSFMLASRLSNIGIGQAKTAAVAQIHRRLRSPKSPKNDIKRFELTEIFMCRQAVKFGSLRFKIWTKISAVGIRWV